MNDVVNDDDRQDRKGTYPKEVGVSRNGKSSSATDLIDIQDDNANDLGKAQRYDGELVTA